MRIVVKRHSLLQDLALFLTVSLLALGSAYCFIVIRHFEAGLGLAIFAIVFALMGFALPQVSPTLVIDETGIYDQRLGVGKIPWSDIKDVQVEAIYGNRFLCLQLRSPERYIAKLRGPKREQVQFHRSLGFGRFNVDVGSLEVSLLDLKKQIELRIAK